MYPFHCNKIIQILGRDGLEPPFAEASGGTAHSPSGAKIKVTMKKGANMRPYENLDSTFAERCGRHSGTALVAPQRSAGGCNFRAENMGEFTTLAEQIRLFNDLCLGDN